MGLSGSSDTQMQPEAGDIDLASLTDGQLVLRACEGDAESFAAAVERPPT
jgi:hypothetical protein